MQIALGRPPADEAETGLHKLSKFLQGNSGLFFTNLPRDDVERMFREFEEHDFARTGCTAADTVELKEGPLEQFTHEMEPFLRKQGLPVRLNKGVVELCGCLGYRWRHSIYTLCVAGHLLSSLGWKLERCYLQKIFARNASNGDLALIDWIKELALRLLMVVIGSSIRSIPITGKDVTQFIHQLLKGP
uniref:Large ribosomal subunit protein uL10-like insertion domain-containing protein n=1 Tax=Zea mays TaxID=4577 RepID=A0A804ME83_MAIZE